MRVSRWISRLGKKAVDLRNQRITAPRTKQTALRFPLRTSTSTITQIQFSWLLLTDTVSYIDELDIVILRGIWIPLWGISINWWQLRVNMNSNENCLDFLMRNQKASTSPRYVCFGLSSSNNCKPDCFISWQWFENRVAFVAYRCFMFLYTLIWSINTTIFYAQRLERYYGYLSNWAEWSLVVYFGTAFGVSLYGLVIQEKPSNEDDSDSSSCTRFFKGRPKQSLRDCLHNKIELQPWSYQALVTSFTYPTGAEFLCPQSLLCPHAAYKIIIFTIL